jgi:hypothetical protein
LASKIVCKKEKRPNMSGKNEQKETVRMQKKNLLRFVVLDSLQELLDHGFTGSDVGSENGMDVKRGLCQFLGPHIRLA